MKILFWGTPNYAVPTLNALAEAGHQLVGVVTQPDRRRGRGKQLIASPVKQRAIELGLKVFTPVRIRKEPELQASLAELDADISVVVAFGQILPIDVLAHPPLGCWNGHGSLLPRWRGAGPIQWSLISGDEKTGVGIMAMEEGLDTGPVLLQESISIGLLDNSEQLANRLSHLTARLMLKALPLIEAAGPGEESERMARLGLTPQDQFDDDVTYARMLTKEDQIIDWEQSALSIHRQVMGHYSNAYTTWGKKRLKIHSTEPLIERLRSDLSEDVHHLLGKWGQGEHKPGEILASETGIGIIVSTGGCPIVIRQAQVEGKGIAKGNVLIQQLQSGKGLILVETARSPL